MDVITVSFGSPGPNVAVPVNLPVRAIESSERVAIPWQKKGSSFAHISVPSGLKREMKL